MRRFLGPGIAIALAIVVIAAVGTVVLQARYGNDFIFLPEPAQPVAPVVKVAGEAPDPPAAGPGLLYVAVGIRRATLWEEIFGPGRRGAVVVPERTVLAPGQTSEQRAAEGREQMSDSQRTAAAVALAALGKPVGVKLARVLAGSPAAKAGLLVGDEIVSIDGKPVTEGQLDVRRALVGHKVGDTVPVHYRRGTQEGTVGVVVGESPPDDPPKRAYLGVELEEILPVDVTYLTKDVGGPSAGLAFALEIYDALTGRKLEGARRIAVTGALAPDGSVVPIGGVEQKAVGAAESGATVFLVPTDDFAAAKKAAPEGLQVIAVTSFDDALRVLRALPA